MSTSRATLAAFVDSSALVALADRGDATHDGAVAAYRELCDAGYRLFTTPYAVVEAHELLALSLGSELAQRWLDNLHIALYYLDEADHARARHRLVTDDRLASRTLTDVLNITAMERLGVRDAFAVDEHFTVETS
jgi:predicted nucleic acid-binding protein